MPSAAVDEFLEKLEYLLSTGSLSNTEKVIKNSLNSNNLQVDKSVITKLAFALCTSNPVDKAVGKGGPQAT